MALLRRLPLPVLILALAAAPAAAQADPVLEYFNSPAGYNVGSGIAAAPDGTVWFSVDTAGSFTKPGIGRLNPAQAVPGTANGTGAFPTPIASTSLVNGANISRSVAYDGEHGRVWFVQSDGTVGWANPALVSPGTSLGMVSAQVSTPLMNGSTFVPDLADIAVAKGGLAWFTERSASNVSPFPGGRIASITEGLGINESEGIATQQGAIFSQRYDPKPDGIATDADGNPWFVESYAGLPGYRITKGVGGGYAEYPIVPGSGASSGTGPTDVAVAQDGSIWFTNELKNELGRLDVNAAPPTFTSYSLPGTDPTLAGGLPREITAAADGTLWVAENGSFSKPNANAIIRVVPSQPTPTMTVHHLGKGVFPNGIAPDTRGNVWFAASTDALASVLGRLGDALGPPVPPGGGGGEASGGGGGTPTTPITPPPGEKKLVPASVGVAKLGNPATDGAEVSVDQICVGPPADPCVLIYILSAHEYVNGFPNTVKGSAAATGKKKGKGKKAKPKPVIYGKKSVTLHGGDKRTVTLSLNKAGKKLLKKKGKVTLYFTATQKGAAGKPATRVKAKKVTFKQPKPKK